MDSKIEVLKQLCREAEEARELFSNAGQELQERTAVAGFLRGLDLPFLESEIVKRGPEPTDVWFREARFQVTEILDPQRRRSAEWKEIAQRRSRARCLEDLVTPGTISSTPTAPAEIFTLVHDRCKEKWAKYQQNCGGVDLLAYVNLRGRHLYPASPWPEPSSLAAMGWRSVAVAMEPYAAVLFADSDAPEFLREVIGEVHRWPGPSSMFPLLRVG